MLRLSSGGGETYYAQRYSVSSVAELRASVDELLVVICQTSAPYDEVLPNGVRAIGLGSRNGIDTANVLGALEQFAPTELVIRTPLRPVFGWAKRRRIRTLGLLADSFPNCQMAGPGSQLPARRLLNDRSVEWIANHNINSSFSLQEVGVQPDKIIPWDWIPRTTPHQFEPKEAPPASSQFTLLYAGALIEEKGVGDLVSAVALLRKGGRDVRVRLAGKGDLDKFRALAERSNINTAVEFLGLVDNQRIVEYMRAADAVIVPSRHSYAEGLPMTIYEALCSRTPIVASDHPMFRGRLVDGESALIFRASAPVDLAAKIEKLGRRSRVIPAHLSCVCRGLGEHSDPRKVWGNAVPLGNEQFGRPRLAP